MDFLPAHRAALLNAKLKCMFIILIRELCAPSESITGPEVVVLRGYAQTHPVLFFFTSPVSYIMRKAGKYFFLALYFFSSRTSANERGTSGRRMNGSLG